VPMPLIATKNCRSLIDREVLEQVQRRQALIDNKLITWSYLPVLQDEISTLRTMLSERQRNRHTMVR